MTDAKKDADEASVLGSESSSSSSTSSSSASSGGIVDNHNDDVETIHPFNDHPSQQSTELYLSSVSEPGLSSQVSSPEENAAEDDEQSRSWSLSLLSSSSSSSSSEDGSKEDIDKPHMTKMSISWIWSRTLGTMLIEFQKISTMKRGRKSNGGFKDDGCKERCR